MSEQIAIVGIGGVFPGANDLEQFWQNIVNGKDCAINVGIDRWRLPIDELYATSLMPDRVNSRCACLIQDFEFDPQGFNLDAALLLKLDPMYQIMLQAGREAWYDAQTDDVDQEHVGIIVGNIVLPTESCSMFSDEIFCSLFEKQLAISTRQAHTSTEALNRYVAGLPAGLLAKALGFGAGAYTLDAACASSLYSLKYAADELLAGRADVMLAGGLSRPDCLYTQMGFSQLNAISKQGRCAPFDHLADGLVVGEGAGIFILKRLTDALNQNDHIYGLISAIGLSSDIQGNIMSPDSEGQLRAMLSAYKQADWLPDSVQHIECHGTGTPVGDAVEYNSLKQLWEHFEAEGNCVIGSVKSNVGHLLTAAGAASLMKTLLAMKHAVLPPTANFETLSDRIDFANSPFQILTEPRAWEQDTDLPKRAAISGFGFGGINAHVLIEEYQQHVAPPVVHVIRDTSTDIAIVGMDTKLGQWDDALALNEALLLNHDMALAPVKNKWNVDGSDVPGFFKERVTVPLGRYRIPPAELKEMLPQQLLMLEVAANALDDAGLSKLTPEQQLRTGVFIGISLDMNTTNFHFRWMQQRYAKQWCEELGIHIDDTALNQWIAKLRNASGPALNANRTMGALGGIVASRIARTFRIGGPSFTLSSEDTSGLHALQRGITALRQNELDQAVIGAVDLAGDPRAMLAHLDKHSPVTFADGATALIVKRHEDAIRDNDTIHAVIKGVGFASSDTQGIKAINNAQQHANERALDEARLDKNSINVVFHSFIHSHVDNLSPFSYPFSFGHMGAASGLVALTEAVTSLKKRLLPATKDSKARYWLKDRQSGPRRCLVSSDSIDGNCASVVLEQGLATNVNHLLSRKLMLVSAASKHELVSSIQSLSFQDCPAADNTDYRAAIFAIDEYDFEHAKIELLNVIDRQHSIDNGRCYYSVQALAKSGGIAFIYPGSGNHFFGMGQELGVAFPQVLENMDAENAQLASQFVKGRFWNADDADPLTHEEVIFGQVWLGTFVSDVVSQFGIQPNAIIGYSLGETTGFFSTRTWTARDEMLNRIRQSSLFTDDLAGSYRSVQQAWQTDESIDWSLGVVNTGAEKVKTVIKDFNRVYLLIINTPTECLIGGDRAQLMQVVNLLQAQFHPLSGVTTVHCEVVGPVAGAYRDLHLFETTPPKDVTFYSGIRGRAYEVTRESAADSILDQALSYFDYTEVINNAYQDGVRYFIEMGPGASCTRMIDQILEDKPHYSKAICVKGQDSVDNLLQLLARLHAEGAQVDASIFSNMQSGNQKRTSDVIHVPVGREAFHVPLAPLQPIQSAHTAEAVNMGKEAKTEASSIEEVAGHQNLLMQDLPRAVNDGLQPLIQQMQVKEQARAEAQETFLRVSQGMTKSISQAINTHLQLLGNFDKGYVANAPVFPTDMSDKYCLFDREQCMEFAVGSIGKLLGQQFADIDQYPTRVRLPDEPLMLVDRIIEIEGEPDSLPANLQASGKIVTEHDVLKNAWYLDQGRIPTCIAVESGQADLFLSGYLGIDHMTHGHAVYRLLDARITFHGPLPTIGDTIHYDIHIDHFFRQGDTWLFRFNFESTVAGEPLLTMTHGCAGFFSQQELDSGQGIVLTSMEKQEQPGRITGGWKPLLPIAKEHYSDEQLAALRRNDLAGCFGEMFNAPKLSAPAGLPDGKMTLVHRILDLDPEGGRYGIGQVTGEADIHPDDWFLTCHFVDDRVMPGTLMYECCLHTLRVYLLRMGWVGNQTDFVYEPIVGEVSQLKCRGQVTEKTKAVQYEITLKEIGYQQDGTPYVIADALMYADHRPVVQMKNMSVQLTGLTIALLDSQWNDVNLESTQQQALFDSESILAFAIGKPSEAFGDRYKVFDAERKIARLPGPPYKFLDRITSITHCQPWVLKAGGVIQAEYDVPADEWYFKEEGQQTMPFAVLLEVALQPCGWLAAYLGSALTSETDLFFRNLGGKAQQFMPVTPATGTLTTRVKITNVSQFGSMIIQNFEYEMHCVVGKVYQGDTYFGFFSAEALADQIGIREARPYMPETSSRNEGDKFAYPNGPNMPDDMMRMIDDVSLYLPDGGSHGLGYIEGTAYVNQEGWFFKAHFYQDPVWPGSLGLESFLQLLKVFAVKRWQAEIVGTDYEFESIALNHRHEWIYRGQILPTDRKVTVQAVISKIDDQSKIVTAGGFLSVDGRIIYQMKDFALRINVL